MRHLRKLVHQEETILRCIANLSDVRYTHEQLFPPSNNMTPGEQDECLGRFCAADILKEASEGQYHLQQDPRHIKSVQIDGPRPVVRLSPVDAAIAEQARTRFPDHANNGIANTQEVCRAVRHASYCVAKLLSGLGSSRLGILHPVKEWARECFLAPEALSGADLVLGTATRNQFLRPEDKDYDAARARYRRDRDTAPSLGPSAAAPSTEPVVARSNEVLDVPSPVLTVGGALLAIEQRADQLRCDATTCRAKIVDLRAAMDALEKEEMAIQMELAQTEQRFHALQSLIDEVVRSLVKEASS